jgi:LemA protein
MSGTQIGVLVAAAVLLFWMLGAYNRLVAQRTAIGEAFAQVQEGLRRRGQAVVTLAAALRGPLAAEQGALDAWLAAHARVLAAADAMGARPVLAPPAQALVAAEGALAAAASRVLALLEQQPALRAGDGVSGTLAAWHDADARLAFARQCYNEAGQVYDDAVRQFPTRLLARTYGFDPAGRL